MRKASPSAPQASPVTRVSRLALQRRAEMLELLTAHGVVRVVELARRFGVSEVTIRHDLEALARQGLAVRDHGGAIARTHTPLAVAFEQRADHRREPKQRIGQAAARLVQPGETILLDAGTTLMEMARALPTLSGLTIVTHALNIAGQVGALPDVHVVMAGGSLSPQTLSTLGPLAERDLADLIVDRLFLGIHAFDAAAGLSDMSLEVARIKQTMIRTARKVILLADSSKWGRVVFAKVAPLGAVHTLITDTEFPAPARCRLGARGIKVVCV